MSLKSIYRQLTINSVLLWNVSRKTARFEVGSKIKESLWTGLILHMHLWLFLNQNELTFLSLKNTESWYSLKLDGLEEYISLNAFNTYLALPKKTGTGGCMRNTSKIKLCKRGIFVNASMESCWFANTVIISFLIFCLYSCSSINRRAIQDLRAPDTPPYELKL